MTALSPIDQLREVNTRLRRFLDQISRNTLEESSRHLACLLRDLVAIGVHFENGSIPREDYGHGSAIREYQQLLQELRRELPAVQARHLAERARLEHERSHLRIAELWTGTVRHTTYFK